MRNWLVDVEKLKKHAFDYKLWRLEQLINFGLGEEKLKRSDLIKFLPKLDIDNKKWNYLRFMISGK